MRQDVRDDEDLESLSTRLDATLDLCRTPKGVAGMLIVSAKAKKYLVVDPDCTGIVIAALSRAE